MLNKITFVTDGDEGHNQWKCLACNSHIDAGYPRYDYSGENPVVVDSGYKFCPICGVKFEGVHPNSKMGTRRNYPFDVTERMTYRHRQLGWIAEAIRRSRADFINDMNEYRNEVAEFLDELGEYQCRDLTWILYKYTGSSVTYRVVVSEMVRSIRSLDECDKILKKHFNDDRKSVGFYPVSDEDFEKLPDNALFLHV